jgi:8-oxo-dGTP pyrophosphatase MutT (NUDIX family)
MTPSSPPVTRDFTVAVFVVHAGRVLLHRHRKLGLWLPPGGHIEPNELPDDAARREVDEEAAIAIELIQDADLPIDRPDQPRQLVRPVGIQLESISEGHEHIDLVYFAVPLGARPDELPPVSEGMVWMSLDDLHSLSDITDEILDWSERAIRTLSPIE